MTCALWTRDGRRFTREVGGPGTTPPGTLWQRVEAPPGGWLKSRGPWPRTITFRAKAVSNGVLVYREVEE